MPDPALCKEEISRRVHAFYARVRQHDVLGPIFDAPIGDRDHHLGRDPDAVPTTLPHG